MDVLEDILGSLRLSGGVVVDGEFSGDFCVSAEFTPGHFEPFYAVPDKLISYHYVRSGTLIVEVEGQPPATLGAGGIAILPRNDPHRLASRAGLTPAGVGEISRITTEGVHRVTTGTDGPKAEVWCGFLETAKAGDHPLLEALPPLLTLNVVGARPSGSTVRCASSPSSSRRRKWSRGWPNCSSPRRCANMSIACRRARAGGSAASLTRRCRKR
ncbi:MAG: cupin domain-containing protein [Sphingomicrobium sp.]